MLDWACCQSIMGQIYRDRLREAEKNWLARQGRAGVGSTAGGAANGLRRRFFRGGGSGSMNSWDSGLAVEGAPWPLG
jgi:hypothetical protein